MTAACAAGAPSAKLGGARTCITSARSVYHASAIIQCLRAAFPVKTWGVVARLFGLSERGAKARLAGDRTFTAEELAILLRTEQGLTFLTALMEGATPQWWLRLQKQLAVADAKYHRRAAERRLQEAVYELEARIDRAETALCVQDEEFGRAQFAAVRASARLPDRSLAAPAARAVSARRARFAGP